MKEEVNRLLHILPGYRVVVTGHSLGAALASLTIADLASEIRAPMYLFNFGCPRVGDLNFAAWFSTFIPNRNRVTHYKDIVPHCPTHFRFTHFSGEFYHEDYSGDDLRACVGFEDPTCSYQWTHTSLDDHMIYLGVDVGCESVS